MRCCTSRGGCWSGPRTSATSCGWWRAGSPTSGPPARAMPRTVTGWALPGLVDAHCHVGPRRARRGGRPPPARSRRSPTATRAPCCSGTPGRPPTPAGSTTARTCRGSSGPAATSPAPAATSATTRTRSSPRTWSPTSRQEARRGDGWVKLVGDWIDRDTGDLGACWPAGRARGGHRRGPPAGRPGHRALLRGGLARRRSSRPASTASSTPPGSPRRPSRCSPSAASPSCPTLVNIATFPRLADGGEAKFPRWAAHMRRLHARRYDTVRAAYDAGRPRLRRHGRGRRARRTGWSPTEVAELVTAGLPAAGGPLRDHLGRPGLAGPPRADRGRPRRPGGLRAATRARTCGCWPRPGGWCCAGRSWASARAGPPRPTAGRPRRPRAGGRVA